MAASRKRQELYGMNFIMHTMEYRGVITLEDIKKFLDDLGLPFEADEVLSMKMTHAGATSRGFLNLKNFFRYVIEELKTPDLHESLQAFKLFDEDENGLIQSEDFRQIMRKLGDKLSDEETDQMLKIPDLDGDNVIYYEEFLTKTLGKTINDLDQRELLAAPEPGSWVVPQKD